MVGVFCVVFCWPHITQGLQGSWAQVQENLGRFGPPQGQPPMGNRYRHRYDVVGKGSSGKVAYIKVKGNI